MDEADSATHFSSGLAALTRPGIVIWSATPGAVVRTSHRSSNTSAIIAELLRVGLSRRLLFGSYWSRNEAKEEKGTEPNGDLVHSEAPNSETSKTGDAR